MSSRTRDVRRTRLDDGDGTQFFRRIRVICMRDDRLSDEQQASVRLILGIYARKSLIIWSRPSESLITMTD